MLTIWGRLSSINVRKVVWCAQELGVAFRRVDAGRNHGIVDSDAYRALNPNGLVPTIEDEFDGNRVVLWESNAIVRYLCARHASGTLHPDGLALRFDAERWMDWQQTTLNRAGRDAFMQWIRTEPGQREPVLSARSVAAAEPLFGLLDGRLAERAYMTGERFTMADIPIGCEIHRWFGLPGALYRRPAWPHLERYFETLRSRAGARGVLDLALE